jgi:hypothetical protein
LLIRWSGCTEQIYTTGLPGWVRPSAAPVTQEQELAWLRNEAEWLKYQFKIVNHRVKALESQEQ